MVVKRQGWTKKIIVSLLVILGLALVVANISDFTRSFPNKSQVELADQTQNDAFSFPAYSESVTDLQEILTEEEERQLSELLHAIRNQDSIEIAIITLENIAPYDSLYNYSLDLGNYWKLGEGYSNKGILIAVSTSLREIRIQNTDIIRSLFSDEKTEAIIANHIVPKFKEEAYFSGLHEGVLQLRASLKSKQ